jgi:manganese/zinc/iron transport system substrate-binding protein
MKIKKFTIALFCLGFLVSCNPQHRETLMVLSTTGMIHNMVQELSGTTLNTAALMGPGIDPHLYKASASDTQKLLNADLILYNGLQLESKLIHVFENIGKKKPTRAVSSNIPNTRLIQAEGTESFVDPHIWFDVSLWQLVLKEIANELIMLNPKNKETYQKNYIKYNQKLTELDDWIQQEINRIPTQNRILVTAHDAFGYFGKKYNIQVVGLQGINTATEVGTKDIQNVANIIVKHKIPTIFIETSVPVRQIKALKAAVAAKGWAVTIGEALYTDAMGDIDTPEGTYIGMMQHNVKHIVNGLKK